MVTACGGGNEALTADGDDVAGGVLLGEEVVVEDGRSKKAVPSVVVAISMLHMEEEWAATCSAQNWRAAAMHS